MNKMTLSMAALCALGIAVAFNDARSLGADPAASAKPVVKHVAASEARKLVDAKQVVVLDVRQPEEYRAGHIAGATNVDFMADSFEQKISQLDTNRFYLVHCASGGRSTRCLKILQNHPFKGLYHLDGGLTAWTKAGLPVEK